MILVNNLGFVAATLTTVCWIPQAFKTIASRDTRSISISAQALYAAGLAIWAIYGGRIGSLPLVSANVVSLIPVSIILVMKLRNLGRDREALPTIIA